MVGVIKVCVKFEHSPALIPFFKSSSLLEHFTYLQAVFTTFIGFYTFGGQPLTELLVVGVSLNTLGAVLYSIFSCLLKRRLKREAEAKKAAEQQQAIALAATKSDGSDSDSDSDSDSRSKPASYEQQQQEQLNAVFTDSDPEPEPEADADAN